MAIEERKSQFGLLVLARARRCALPLTHVLETMRPLDIEPIVDAPAGVLGVSIVRGAVVPVLDLGAIVGAEGPRSTLRFVALRGEGRDLALAVERVLDVVALADLGATPLVPLLRGIEGDVVAGLAGRDAAIVRLLSAAWRVPEWLVMREAAAR